jgi:hypothetical protein
VVTKKQAYQAIERLNDRSASFVTNIVMCGHKNPAKKLRGILNLLNAGHTVSAGNTTDHLLIDGVTVSWCVLEEWSTRKA